MSAAQAMRLADGLVSAAPWDSGLRPSTAVINLTWEYVSLCHPQPPVLQEHGGSPVLKGSPRAAGQGLLYVKHKRTVGIPSQSPSDLLPAPDCLLR